METSQLDREVEVAPHSHRLGDFVQALAPYRQPSLAVSLWQLGSSLFAFVALWTLMWVSLDYSYLITLCLAIPTGGCLVRLFVLQHDCGHGSFFKSKQGNDFVGCALSLLTCTPYYRWRKGHAVHHATSGDLDRRGLGDVWMLTVAEYSKLSKFQQLVYRVSRHPVMLFVIGPFFYFAVYQRFAALEPRTWKKERRNVYWTNVGLLAVVMAMSWLIGFQAFCWVHLPVIALSSSGGVWLFYVQHHFEHSYWERKKDWNFVDAGLDGSTYYQLPKVLQWFTANIGLHHIHHLDHHIPNYLLQKCYDENPEFQRANRLTLRNSLACATLTLWDEEQKKMVGFPKAS